MPELTPLVELLGHAPMRLVGQVATASNAVFLVEVDELPTRYAVYKPVRGERPLWDFPHGTLAGREYAAWLVSEAAGWGLVPPTVLREGEFGLGAVQLWVGDPFAAADQPDLTDVVDVVPGRTAPDGWLSVLEARSDRGEPVLVVHEDQPDVRAMAVFDAVTNNADRKGSHARRDPQGRLWGFDHGLTMHAEPKLRTALWGWAGQPLPEVEVTHLGELDAALAGGPVAGQLADVLPAADLTALRERTRGLLERPIHPEPSRAWPSIPWPVL